MKKIKSKFDDVAKNACKSPRALASTLKNVKLEAFEKLQKEIKNNQIEVENNQEEFEIISGSTLLSDDIKAIPMLLQAGGSNRPYRSPSRPRKAMRKPPPPSRPTNRPARGLPRSPRATG